MAEITVVVCVKDLHNDDFVENWISMMLERCFRTWFSQGRFFEIALSFLNRLVSSIQVVSLSSNHFFLVRNMFPPIYERRHNSCNPRIWLILLIIGLTFSGSCVRGLLARRESSEQPVGPTTAAEEQGRHVPIGTTMATEEQEPHVPIRTTTAAEEQEPYPQEHLA